VDIIESEKNNGEICNVREKGATETALETQK